MRVEGAREKEKGGAANSLRERHGEGAGPAGGSARGREGGRFLFTSFKVNQP